MKVSLKVVSILVIIAVCAAWVFYPVWSGVYRNLLVSSSMAEMGVFGDSFGALNTLFSGLAFTGIIVSIFIQSEELKATREELEATRFEMKSQGEQFKAQTEVLNLQVFENTFFNMLKLHGDIVESMIIRSSRGTDIKGRPVFKMILNECDDLQYRISGIHDFVALYEHYHPDNEAVMGHYFRTMYQIINLVDSSSLDDMKKKTYVKILMAQLSTYEIILFFIHCLSKYGEEKYKPLIEKYSFFEHLSISCLRSTIGRLGSLNEMITRYDVSAYGESNNEVSGFYLPY
ncbi:putative phage abortive infection protein [Aeromonas veronii]